MKVFGVSFELEAAVIALSFGLVGLVMKAKSLALALGLA